MSGNRSIITLIMRQRLHRDAGAVVRAKSLKKTAKETNEISDEIRVKYNSLNDAQIKSLMNARELNKESEDMVLSHRELDLTVQSQALRMITLVQMSRFFVSDLQEFAKGENVIANIISMMSSALIMAYQYNALMKTNQLLAQQTAATTLAGSVGGTLAGIHPALLIGLTFAGALASSTKSGVSTARTAQLRRTAYSRITR